MMRYLILSLIFLLAGCASVQMPGYIGRVDHPYERKFYGSFEKVVCSFVYVLKKQGWRISEADPAIYERDDRYDSNGYQNLLIITDIKKNARVIYSTFTHLNIFIHCMNDNCDVELRYESQTPMVKRFTSARNDRMVQGIFDTVEQEVNE